MKRIGLLIFLTNIILSGTCQENNFFKDFGIVAGAGVSSGQNDLIWETSFSYMFGVETSLYNFNEKSSIRSGIVFTKQGGPNYIKDITGYTEYGESYRIWSDGVTSLYYFIVPLLYQFKSKGGLYLEGGIQTGILLGAQKDGSEGNGDAKENFETLELSIPLGIGYWFNERLSIGLRSTTGLTNINSTKIQEEVWDNNDHSSVLMAVARFNFK